MHTYIHTSIFAKARAEPSISFIQKKSYIVYRNLSICTNSGEQGILPKTKTLCLTSVNPKPMGKNP